MRSVVNPDRHETMVYNLTMSGLKTHAAAVAAALVAAALLAFLIWRGLKEELAPDSSSQLVWREADEADLF